MTVVSIKFKGRGKTYYFDPNGLEVPAGAQVVVETSKGLELAVCVQGNHEVTDERIVPPLRPVVRIATQDDLRIAELCKTREKEAFAIADRCIADSHIICNNDLFTYEVAVLILLVIVVVIAYEIESITGFDLGEVLCNCFCFTTDIVS